jgi:hypothetical protein
MTYFYKEVQSGGHILSTESEFSNNDLLLDAEAGRNYFVRQYIKMGLFVGGANLELVSEEEGKKGVLECKLADSLYGNVVEISKDVITTVPSSQTNPEGATSVFDYYGQAEAEIDTETYDKNLWAKALVETEGDQTKRKARYIELRANQLYYESTSISLNANIAENLDKQIVPLENALTATYISKYTGKDLEKSPDFRKANFQVKLVQDGKKITGTFGQKGKVWGDIVDETIKFEIFATGGFSRRGTWVIDPVNNNLEGNIGSNAAEGWDLIRIQ